MGEDGSVNANPTVLVVQHDLDSPLAALAPPLAALGVRTTTWQALSQPEPPSGEFDGLIVLGGIVNPDGTDGDAPLEREREAIAAAHERGVPVLGICLGAQLISQALGGSAERMPAGTGEIGWVRIELDPAAADDPLLTGTPPTMNVLEWHNFSCTPPAAAVRLGHSPSCVQAFRVGATSWGLQFHVEATRPLLEEWTVAGASELEARGIRPAAVLGTGSQRAEQLLLATRIADRFGRAVLAAAIPA
jgi:GMP synthase (glutamine-hydrolysing)